MRLLKAVKTCNLCQAEFDRVPEGAREGKAERDEFPGFYWECSCKSTMYAPTSAIDPVEYCDCVDCVDSEAPCALDCGDCVGCREAYEEEQDKEFEWAKATGRLTGRDV